MLMCCDIETGANEEFSCKKGCFLCFVVQIFCDLIFKSFGQNASKTLHYRTPKGYRNLLIKGQTFRNIAETYIRTKSVSNGTRNMPDNKLDVFEDFLCKFL